MMEQKILIIEDDRPTCRAYKDNLERNGFKVDAASDGEEGLKKMRENKPDLLLLDLMLSGTSGFAVLERLKNDEVLKKIPVVILTNLGQEVDIKRGKELGAVDYLVKTHWSLKEVVEKIRFHINQSEQVKK